MNNRNMSRELPQHLSPLSPLEIGTMIKQRVRRIEGPISATIMVPTNKLSTDLGRDGPVIVLLYDYHVGNQRCDSCDVKDGCYSLYSPSSFLTMINDLSRDESISTDLFLETWLSKSEREKFNNSTYQLNNKLLYNSALVDSILWSVKCMTRERRLDCPLPNIRTHMSDIRKITDSHTFNSIVRLLDNMIQFMKGDVSLETGILRVKGVIKKKYNIDPNDVFDLIDRFFHNKCDIIEVFTHPFYNNSRFKHEFNQLPVSIQNTLINRTESIKDVYSIKLRLVRLDNFENTFNDFIAILKDPSINHNYNWDAFEQIVNTLHNSKLFIYLDAVYVDIYTVSRLLKTFKGGLPSQLSVIYLGWLHSDNIVKMLSAYYEIIQTYGYTNFNNKTKNINFSNKKCINEMNSTFRDVNQLKGGKRYKKTINHNKKMSKHYKKMKITTQKAHKYNKKYKTQKKRLI